MSEAPNSRAEAFEPVVEFHRELIRAGLLVPTDSVGVYGFGAMFEAIIEGVNQLVGKLFSDRKPEVLRFPPIMTTNSLHTSRYLEGFPHLAGTVFCFCGDLAEHRQMLACIGENGDWSNFQKPANLSLTPASCYPVYPLVARRGQIPDEGITIDVSSYCFRHEPSKDPIRLQMFRQREHVFCGHPSQTIVFQQQWMERTLALLDRLSLEAVADTASDAFFGRLREMLSSAQKTERLKLEVLVPISNPARLTACGSVNHHKTHFSTAFGIYCEDKTPAHTSCAGFGLERLALALLRRHGFSPRLWPMKVQKMLKLDA